MNNLRKIVGLTSLLLGAAIAIVIARIYPEWNYVPEGWLIYAICYILWLSLSALNKIGMVLNQQSVPLNIIACGSFGVLVIVSEFFSLDPGEPAVSLTIVIPYAILIFGWLLVDFFDIWTEKVK